jgi:hypothetical protein
MPGVPLIAPPCIFRIPLSKFEKLMQGKGMSPTTTENHVFCTDADPSLVHPLETSVESQIPLSYQDYKAAHHREEYQAALDLYCRIDNAEGSHRAEQFLECRQWAWFARHETTGMVKVIANSCHLRWCPICAEAKSHLITGNIKDWLEGIRRPKFFTLTVAASNEPLAVQITRLYKQFRSFRNHKSIKNAVRGGIWFFQITYRPKSKTWHPHLHCVLDANYISQRILSLEWLATTGNSFIVDIRAVKDNHKAANDVARYSSRPCSLSNFKNIDNTEIFSVFHGKRLCGSFGTGRNVLLRPKPPEDFKSWKRLPSWKVVISARHDGSVCQAIYKAWATNTPVALDAVKSAFIQSYDENTIDTFFLTVNKPSQMSFEQFY